MASAAGGNGRGGTRPSGGRLEQELTSLRFATVARRLSDAARVAGVAVPGFRSPPRAAGVRRSIRREVDGSATIAVAIRGRTAIAVIADMIEGVVTASGLVGVEASVVRDQRWAAAARFLDEEGDETTIEPHLFRRAA